MNSSSATNSSLSSFSEECEATLPEPPPPPPPPLLQPSSIDTTNNEHVSGKKLVHKVEPIFNNDKTKMRIFLEDGSLSEYSIEDATTAEELIIEIAQRHSLGSDMRRYRLTLCEAHDVSWRYIRYIRPQQKLVEVSQWSCTTPTTICTLRVVIVPAQAEILADSEPITFTYLYRQSINDYVRERAGSEISVDIAVQLTALLILDESLCTGVRTNILVKRSWLLKQLMPRSLLDQFSLKQMTHRVRNHLHDITNITQLAVARQFIRLFSDNTRSFAGKLFPVKFPDKHRDSILLVGSKHPVAILDQARRIHSPVITLVSAWSHLSRVVIKQYRNGVAIRLLISPQTTSVNETSLLHQEISFLIHTNLLNDLMTFIEGYSQLESSNSPLSIERVSHISQSKVKKTLMESHHESSTSSCRSPLVDRILSTSKTHRRYTFTQETISPPASPSLFELTRQFFSRNPTKNIDEDEQETISNVPNRTTLVTWRSIADNHSLTPLQPPPPILYRTVIDVKPTEGQMKSIIDDNDCDDEPDAIDLTTSYGYYGSLTFPIRPPSPFADGLIWSQTSNQQNESDDSNGVVVWSPTTKQLSIHYNINNSNNNNLKSYSPIPLREISTWKRAFDKIFKRSKSKNMLSNSNRNSCDLSIDDDMQSNVKHVHWTDEKTDHSEAIFNICHRFVEYLKTLVQNIIHDQDYENDVKNCQIILNELHLLTDCSQLQQAFQYTIELANNCEKNQLLQQQTYIAHLISRTILTC